MSSRALPGPIHAVPVDNNDRRIDDLRDENRRLHRELDDLQAEHNALKTKFNRTTRAAANFKQWLQPLRQFLKAADGEFDDMDLEDVASVAQAHPSPTSSNSTHYSPRMEAALARLSGVNHKILKAIIDVGPITQVALSKMVGCAEGTASNTCSHLKTLGFIRQNAQKRWEISE
jgi:FtsZ-binding cell division protein ZapB